MDLSAVEVILFDMDDVLLRVKDEQGRYIWRESIEADLGIDNAHMTEFFTGEGWKKITRGQADAVTSLDDFLSQKGSSVRAEAVFNYFYEKNSIVIPEMFNMAKKLAANYEIYLATNQDKGRIEFLWNKYFCSLGFKRYFSSHKIGALKPDSAYFEFIYQSLGGEKNRTLLIDDKEKNVKGSLDFGFQAYHYRGREMAFKEIFNPLLQVNMQQDVETV